MRIARERPELRAFVAMNPAAHPALLAWLRDLGDPAVTAALASRGDSSGSPVPTPPRRPRGRRRRLLWLTAGLLGVVAIGGVVAVIASRADSSGQAANAVMDTIKVGDTSKVGGVTSVALDPASGTALICTLFGPPVILDTKSHQLVATVAAPNGAHHAAVNPQTHLAYVTSTSTRDPSVTVINLASRTVVATVPVGAFPFDVAVDSGTHSVWVTTPSGSRGGPASEPVTVIDTLTNQVVSTIMVGAGPLGVAVDSANHTAYVTNGGGTVSVIDTVSRKVTATVPVGRFPRDVQVDSGAHLLLVSNAGDGTVSMIDTTSKAIVGTLAVDGAGAIIVDPGLHVAYVQSATGATVIDTRTRKILSRIAFHASGYGISDIGGSSADPLTHNVYFANSDTTITVLKRS